MARSYDDDLRRKYLEAYDRGDGTLGELALRFGVSQGWGWKVSAARKRTGQMERWIGRRGRPSRVSGEVLEKLRDWIEEKPDLTLTQLQEKLLAEVDLHLSIGRLWQLLRQLDLRLKKSRSTPSSGTPKPIKNAVSSSSRQSVLSRRNA